MKRRNLIEIKIKHLTEKLEALEKIQSPAPETVIEILELRGQIKALKWVLTT